MTALSSIPGTFSTIFTVDVQRRGSNTVIAIGLSSITSARGDFAVQPTIIKVSPTSGTVGVNITVEGASFDPPGVGFVWVSLGTQESLGPVTPSEFGTWTWSFSLSTQVYGTKTVTACQSITYVYSKFWVRARLTLVSPNTGPVGTIVTVRGDGYGGSERCIIKFGTTFTITTYLSTADGEIQNAIFTIDTQPYGTHTVLVTGISTAVATGTFTIVPKIILVSPT